jgi:hypothetical protein
MPLAAYDIDANPPQRLAVGFMENNVTNGTLDGYYWPPHHSYVPGGNNTAANSPREWLFVLNAPYTGATTNTTFHSDILTSSATPIMYWSTWNRFTTGPWPTGNAVTLRAYHPVGNGDRWTFNPFVLAKAIESSIPTAFALHANFPNPFNPLTTIRYDLPVAGVVTIRIFDVLGRMITELVGEEKTPGVHDAQWNAAHVSSGLYIYTIEVHNGKGSLFSASKRMVLVK